MAKDAEMAVVSSAIRYLAAIVAGLQPVASENTGEESPGLHDHAKTASADESSGQANDTAEEPEQPISARTRRASGARQTLVAPRTKKKVAVAGRGVARTGEVSEVTSALQQLTDKIAELQQNARDGPVKKPQVRTIRVGMRPAHRSDPYHGGVRQVRRPERRRSGARAGSTPPSGSSSSSSSESSSSEASSGDQHHDHGHSSGDDSESSAGNPSTEESDESSSSSPSSASSSENSARPPRHQRTRRRNHVKSQRSRERSRREPRRRSVKDLELPTFTPSPKVSVSTWIDRVDLALRGAKESGRGEWSDESLYFILGNKLLENAARWWVNMNRKLPRRKRTWTNLKQSLLRRYGEKLDKSAAEWRVSMRRMMPGETYADFAAGLRDVVGRNRVSERVLLAQFCRCLDKTTKKLVNQAPEPKTLEEAADKATEIDDPMDNVAQGMLNISQPWATAPSPYLVPMTGTTGQTLVIPGIGGTELTPELASANPNSKSLVEHESDGIALFTNPQGV